MKIKFETIKIVVNFFFQMYLSYKKISDELFINLLLYIVNLHDL